MNRRKHSRLTIWMNGEYVGYWDVSKQLEVLQYDEAWVNNHKGRPLSLSLPFVPGNFPHKGAAVQNYFDNLLPDSKDIRKRIQQKYNTRSNNHFDLLLALGRDCVGAIQLLPLGERPQDIQTIKGKLLNEHDVAEILRGVVRVDNEAGDIDTTDFRISIAGAQEKTALLWHNDNWHLPTGSTPSTHIFKLPIGLIGNARLDLASSIENEWLCLKLLHHYGLDTVNADILYFEDQKTLCVERFDRQFSEDGSWIIRLPQEDFCQIYGLAPEDKYQSDAGVNGVGITKCMDILKASEEKDHDEIDFFACQIIFWLLQANDGHAKNFSIQHLGRDRYRMTKIYDVLSFIPMTGKGNNQIHLRDQKLAMAFSGSRNYYDLARIQKRHMINHGASVGLTRKDTAELIESLCIITPEVIEQTRNDLPQGFNEALAEQIFSVLSKRAQTLLKMPNERMK